jgi:hypothetical protein
LILSEFERLRTQLPDLEKSLEVVKKLQENSAKEGSEGLQTHFLVSEQLYTQALIPPTKTVCLWLGVSPVGGFRILF